MFRSQQTFKRPVSRAALILLVVSLPLVLATSAEATFPGENGKIAFGSNRTGNFDVWTMDGAGNALTQLTTNGASDSDPAWSANGTKIVFVSNRDGNNEIYTMNADGTGQTRVTNNPAFDADPAWSPDGTQIAFASDRDGHFEIYKMNADGTAQTRLTNTSLSVRNGFPNWSPDGTKIAFETNRDGNYEIYKMNPDGSNQTNLTNNAAQDQTPNWSPDGKFIYFAATRSGPDHDIWRMNADGSNQVAIVVVGGSEELFPASVPSGGDIGVAQSNVSGGQNDIWFFPSIVDLTNNAAEDLTPDWQPIVPSYPRPRGATPYRISLVPALQACTNPTSTHAAPISTGSCHPVQQTSSYLTVGTPDFNGQPANSIGSVVLRVVPDNTSTPQDESDGTVNVSDTDVRCKGASTGCSGALADYSGSVLLDMSAQITDKNSGGAVSATAQSYAVRANVPCTTTASTSIGSTCSLTSSLNAIVGAGAVVRQKRAVWELTQVRLLDGGADGNGSTLGDDTVFANGGLFFP
jgi:Tol biopolymer transport system component